MWFLLGLLVGILSPSVAVVEEYLNTSVNPCDDFYEYSCGRWGEVHSDAERGDILSLLDLAINEKIGTLLDANPPQQGIPTKVRTFYSSCRELKEHNLAAYLGIVKPKGGWAALTNNWAPADFDWLDTVAELRKYGFQLLLEMNVRPKWDNTSVNSIYLGLVKASDFQNEESLRKILKKASIPEAESLAHELLEYECVVKKLLPSAFASPTQIEMAEVITLEELAESYQEVNWRRYLSKVFGREFDLHTQVMVQHTQMMPELVEFLELSKPKMICNYIMVKFLQFIDQHANGDTSSRQCASALHQSMPLAVGYIIEQHLYDPEFDQVVNDMFNFFKVEFLTQVTKVYKNERDALLFLYSKATMMELQIGNAERNLTLDAVTRYYENLQLEKSQFYKNFLSAFKFKTQKDLDSYNGVSVNITYQWSISTNPFFVYTKNRIVVPLSLLQDGILGRDSADRYSILEFIVAHEFLHAFDMNGVSYDYEGNMYANALSQSDVFNARVKCVSSQMNIGPLCEKIADLGAIRLAFNAYRKTVTQLGKSLSANDGCDRSLAHAFFINFAQFFCGPTGMEENLESDHLPDNVRVWHSVMHFEEFANTFMCPFNSCMNPERKCRIW